VGDRGSGSYSAVVKAMRKTAVLNVVGLTPRLLGPAMPRVTAWTRQAAQAAIHSAFPAVTCTAQSDYLTGQYPDVHGIVGNGWYFRDECEVHLWKQSNKLVQAPKIWDAARAIDPSFTCANLFWWFNMYSSADYSVTPRPMYLADGRKLPDAYSHPDSLRTELQAKLGTFPLFEFWGPRTTIRSSQWIAEAAKYVDGKFSPTLSLVYLPHLDYNLQRFGTSRLAAIEKDLGEIDAVCGDLIAYFESRGADVILLSEYGLTDVSKPLHLNRVLRERGLIAVREERGLELLDCGASAAFAVADHQVAHVYVNDKSRLSEVRGILEATPGVETVLDQAGKARNHNDHARAGVFVAISQSDAWFTYYYWLDDRKAPDFARTVDIHRKPGYDPVELFTDPAIRLLPAKVAWKLMKRKLGFRTLLDLIPLDASLVKGSHGRVVEDPADGPVFLTRRKELLTSAAVRSVDVYGLIMNHLTRV
jgi:predicted AlkP superfamily pyrophosphatase or phosphodiesterase